MVRLGPKGNLSCFYCGKRSPVKFDGVLRDFFCLHCDATNYLDENGEITDPPVATTASATSTQPQYAVPRSRPSPTASSPSQSIFCATCLKNQHLFTSSLAQYLPDDPDDPDYAQRERDYYKFRKHLEARYPQICADCEPKVLAQVSQAGYTAQTDHLRRMMDRSRQQRATPKQWTALDAVDGLGRWLWRAALVLQLIWHLAAMMEQGTTTAPEPLTDPDQKTPWLSSVLDTVAGCLPTAPLLITWSIRAHAASIWWNPRFVQVFRGFSKHILGLSQWYAFQAFAMAVRLAGQSMTDHASRSEVATSARISLHGFLAIAMVVFFARARDSVRIDTTPLFQTTVSPTPSPPRAQRPPPRQSEAASMSNLLDEILDEPPRPSAESFPVRPSPSPTSSSPFQNTPQNGAQSGPNYGTRSPELNKLTSAPAVQYSEEMDWSPTQSKHRAFTQFGAPSRAGRGFNPSPASADPGPFWYKVPPAPVAPAHRSRNNHDATQREKPAMQQQTAFSSFNSKLLQPTSKTSEVDDRAERKVTFAQPTFFSAQQSESNAADPRNSLADLLSSSFNFRQDEDELSVEGPERRNRLTRARLDEKPACQSQSAGALVDVVLAVVLLAVWAHATTVVMEEWQMHSRDIMLGCLGLSVAVTVHITRDAVVALGRNRGSGGKDEDYTAQVGNATLGLCEVIGCSMLMLQVWGTRSVHEAKEFAWPGNFVFAILFLHAMGNYVGPRLVK